MHVKSLAPPWVRSLEPYPPGKPIEELEREYGISSSIKLASNENPLGPSPRAVAAMQEALSEVHRYPDGGCYYLKRGLARKLGVSADSLVIGNGSNEIIELAVRTFLRAGEEAVMADQAFVIYRMLVQSQGGRSVCVPLRDYTHDLVAMAEAVTPATRMVFLANPNNPTGTIVDRERWEKFLSVLPPEVIVVMDEAYAEFVDDPKYPDAVTDIGGRQPMLVLRTFSKVYGLAGLRIGYAVAQPEIVDLVNRMRAPFNVNSLAQAAALAALDDDEHVAKTRRINREGMSFLCDAFVRAGLEFVPSWANFLLVRVGDAAGVYDALLRQGVIVRPVPVYGFPQHLRITVGLPEENERLVQALGSVLADGAAGGKAV